MSVTISFIQEEDRLDISFTGNLDVTVWQEVCGVCSKTTPRLKTCIVDLARVGRVFDSGMAILSLLYWHMKSIGTTVIFLSDDSDLKQHIAALTPTRWKPHHIIA